MRELLSILEPADFRFMAGIMGLPPGFMDQPRDAVEARFEKELRYLGSSDLMYAVRSLSGGDAGVPFHEIVRDAANTLDVPPPAPGTDREMVEELAAAYATATFAKLSPEEQQHMLEDLGIDTEKAAAFLARSAGVFALPVLIEAFSLVVVHGLIKTIIFGTIARIIGRQLAGKLFTFLVGRLPWWVTWVGPAAWTLSIGWTAIDLQGPARRKTVPVVLYLGVCSLRQRTGHTDLAEDALQPDA